MRTNPDKYYSLVYSNNPRLLSSSKGNGHSNYKYISSSSEKHEERQSQYDYFSIEDCQTELLDQVKEFYMLLVDRFVCEVINGIVTNKQHAAISASLPLEFHNTQENHDSDDDKQ